jgi:hypothetical protein
MEDSKSRSMLLVVDHVMPLELEIAQTKGPPIGGPFAHMDWLQS